MNCSSSGSRFVFEAVFFLLTKTDHYSVLEHPTTFVNSRIRGFDQSVEQLLVSSSAVYDDSAMKFCSL